MKYPTKAEQEQAAKIWAKIVARAWEDEAFKRRLLKQPNEVLKEYGLGTPQGATFKIHEETDETEHLILPRRSKEKLSTQEMQKIAAAGSVGGMSIIQE